MSRKLRLSRMSQIELIQECISLDGIISGQRLKINSMLDLEQENKELKKVISRKNQKIARQKDKIKGWMDKMEGLYERK